MKRDCRLLTFTTIWVGLGMASTLVADDPRPTLERKIATLVQQLGADEFSKREKAANELFEMGEEVRPELERLVRDLDNLEIRTQIGTILKRMDRADLESTEVHAIGLYAAVYPQYIIETHGRRVDWENLCTELVNQGKAGEATPGKRIWDLLDDQARDIASDPDRVAAIMRWTAPAPDADSVDASGFKDCRRLSNALTAIVSRDDFYDEKLFSGLELHPEAKELLKRVGKLSQLEKLVLHRRLLEASFPKAFTPAPFTLENATVPIRVKASSRPIVLVLTSNESVRWEIKLDEGATLKRIIVSGHHPQLVAGATAPTESYIYDDPNNHDRTYFYAYKRDSKEYKTLVDAVKDLTGLPITSFQGRNSTRDWPDGFIVGGK